ncbi:MAG: MBL fold metallo-hydrolase [Clostridia bacterium]|nr:MBL fold metallo-hydrolase [Clostridia bacterium]
MNVTWLTQGGLLFENGKITVMVDPYLSNSVAEKFDPAKKRRIPVDESFFDISPDVIIITHEHIDHLDPETLQHYLSRSDKCITVLAPGNAYLKLRAFGGIHNYVLLAPHSVWSEGGVTFYAVSAAHSDPTAAGYIIDDGERTYYVSGDTLYNYDVIDDVIDLCEDGVDYAFLPVNGVGNNMNMRDAADFACEIGAKCAVPIHWGLFDSLDPKEFDFDNALILKPWVRFPLK